MPTEGDVARHYTHGSLTEAIRQALEKLGKTPRTVTVDDLAPIDEFHIGGRQASEDFLGQLGVGEGALVLDVGSGVGGTSRFAAMRHGWRLTGIDLTPEYVETARELNHWLGLNERIDLRVGSALDLPFENGRFDAAYMLHVGMNIADKGRLFAEVARVLKPEGSFGVYDVMRTGEGDIAFPVPWAATPATSFLATPADYRAAFAAAGFRVRHERNRREFALSFFEAMQARIAVHGPPPLGLHVLMGETRAEKVRNMIANVKAGLIAPVEMIGVKG
jgi:SAM-dependent methyltransferase